jgi:hypothetical protein
MVVGNTLRGHRVTLVVWCAQLILQAIAAWQPILNYPALAKSTSPEGWRLHKGASLFWPSTNSKVALFL